MSEVVKNLHEVRLNAWEQAKALAETAAGEKRSFSGEEEATWKRLNSEIDALDERIQQFIDAEKRSKDVNDAVSSMAAKPAERKADESGSELRSWLLGESGGRAYDVKPSGPVDVRALNKLTAGAGGNTVPTDFYNRLVAHLIEVAGIMQTGPTVLNTAGGESLQIPKTTSHSTAAIVTEGAALAETDPVFGQVTLGAFKYGNLLTISRELLADTGVDIEGYLAMQSGRALGNAFGAHAITGTGTTQPRGVLTDATLGVTGASGLVGAPNGDNMIDMFHSVIPPYRNSASCAWLMKDSTLASVRKLKDGTTGVYVWQPGLQVGDPDRILGKPVVIDPTMPATALSAKSILFGDFSQYFVRLVGPVRYERSDDFAFSSDMVTFRAIMRADAALVDLTGAVKYLQGNAA